MIRLAESSPADSIDRQFMVCDAIAKREGCTHKAGHRTLTVPVPQRSSRRITASVIAEDSGTGQRSGFSASELLELAGAPVRSASTSQRRSKLAFSPRASATDV